MNRILFFIIIPIVVVTGIFLVVLGSMHSEGPVNDFLVSITTPADRVVEEVIQTLIPAPVVPAPVLSKYIEVLEGCGSSYGGEEGCVNMRSGPGQEYPVVAKLRIGMVLKVGSTVSKEGGDWYKIQMDRGVRYPERVSSEWYVSADVVHAFMNEGDIDAKKGDGASTAKRILVDRSEQKLYAYEGDVLFMEQSISTGLDDSPTPRGTFSVYRKTPSRYMQGPLPGISEQYYDLPGVPWNLYFTQQGAVVHGAYWHDNFGQQWSHGCVNLPPGQAQKLYEWADIGMPITIRD